ncbi:unnamed protein product [Pleuronectes platessa]|uniref:Uncharacterized protein n=1 Tax=Pleuronectes platessa TaxID=8262 RepID=A0A9N7VVV6_PLEPL|nr:unnamed protein product [Pleuronectes platessa]
MIGDENEQFVRSSSSSSGQEDAGSCSLELRERTSLLLLPPSSSSSSPTSSHYPRSPETHVDAFTLPRCIKRITRRFIFIIIIIIIILIQLWQGLGHVNTRKAKHGGH